MANLINMAKAVLGVETFSLDTLSPAERLLVVQGILLRARTQMEHLGNKRVIPKLFAERLGADGWSVNLDRATFVSDVATMDGRPLHRNLSVANFWVSHLESHGETLYYLMLSMDARLIIWRSGKADNVVFYANDEELEKLLGDDSVFKRVVSELLKLVSNRRKILESSLRELVSLNELIKGVCKRLNLT